MEKLTQDAIEALGKEQREIKLDSVHTAISQAKMLFGFGIAGYETIITEAGAWFNKYYDMDMETLHLEIENMSAMCNKHCQDLHFNGENITRVLGDSEQDIED